MGVSACVAPFASFTTGVPTLIEGFASRSIRPLSSRFRPIRISMTSPSVRSSSSLMIPRRSSSGVTRRLSTIRCIREIGLSIVGRKSLNDAMWWFTMLRSWKNASTRSRIALPPDDEAVRLGDAGGLVQPQHAEDAALLDRPVDPLEHADHRVRLPDLRELVPRHAEPLEDGLRFLGGQQSVLRDQFVFEHVKSQGGASGSWYSLSHVAARAGPRGFSKPPPRSAEAFSNPGPPGFLPVLDGPVKSQMLFLGTACTTRPT